MVAGKRHGELSDLGERGRRRPPVLAAYTPSFLPTSAAVFSGGVLDRLLPLGVLVGRAPTPTAADLWFQLSIVPFAVAILRYALLLEQGEGAEPETPRHVRPHACSSPARCWAIIYGCAVYAA